MKLPAEVYPRIEAWSLTEPVSEAEFLRREIGLDVQAVSPSDLQAKLSTDRVSVVVISEATPYRDLLHGAPPGSVVAFLISDEGYTDDRRELIASSPAVRAVFRHYGLSEASLADITSAASDFWRACRSSDVSPRVLPRLLATGRATRARMTSWRAVQVPVHEVPLGYTTEFARAYVSTLDQPQPENASLFALPRPIEQPRPVEITFRGSPSTAQRQALVEQARHRAGNDVHWVDATWTSKPGRERALRYVQDLQASTFALCPPGAVNTETFRYYEALLCGAQPIEPRTALTHLGRPVARGGNAHEAIRLALHSVRHALGEVTGGPHD